MAAACGAAAEVPKKGLKSLTSVDTPSAAVRSGFWRTTPPVDEKLPGGAPGSRLPFTSKKIRRGPSQVKGSGSCAAVKGLGKGPFGWPGRSAAAAGAAATPKAAAAELWPRVQPAVASCSSAAEGEDVEQPVGAAGEDDHHLLAGAGVADDLDRVLGAALGVGRCRDDVGEAVVEDVEVVVVAGGRRRVGPVQHRRRPRASAVIKSDWPPSPKSWVAPAPGPSTESRLPLALKSPSQVPEVPASRLPSLPADEK